MTKSNERPDFIDDNQLEWLDDLREGGSINMLGAAKPLAEAFPELTSEEAKQAHVYWMKTFGQEDR